MKTFLLILTTAVVAGTAGWWLAYQSPHAHGKSETGTGKVRYYQSPMHPWVKSDSPGNCTVCGMELVPVYEGAAGHEAATTDLVMLPEGSPTISSVKVVEVRREPLIRTLRVAGIIDDNDSRHRILSAYIPARIEKLFVNFEGADVEAGQPLATFYSKELLAAASEYRVMMNQTGGIAQKAAESRLRQFGLTEDQIRKIPQRAETDLYFEIVAPIAGTVVKRYVYEGQYVQEGEKLFELADFNIMWFQFAAYEQDLPFLREGLQVTISTPSLPGRTIVAPIKFINPNLDDTTRSAMVRVEFENPTREAGGLHQKHEILHKAYASATVSLDAPEVLAVPRNAVLWSGNNARLYVEKGPGVYEQHQIILGRMGDELWEVLEGVQAGERVVASGGMLIDGQAQINNLGRLAEGPGNEIAPAIDLTASEHGQAEEFLLAAAELSDALANDDLAAYNTALAKLPEPPVKLKTPKLTAAKDIAGARLAFLPFSQAVSDYSLQVRGHFPKLRVFRCPMSDMVAEGAPENAKWIQFSADLRNPYMGKEMLRCGAEIK